MLERWRRLLLKCFPPTSPIHRIRIRPRNTRAMPPALLPMRMVSYTPQTGMKTDLKSSWLTGVARVGYLAAPIERLLRVHSATHPSKAISLAMIGQALGLSFIEVEAAALWLAKFGLVDIVAAERRS